MVLTSAEIAQKAIVGNSQKSGQRATTYDATVGCIIKEGREIAEASYMLAPRGIVWVVSAETFNLPGEVTGLATLRTTWTHEGILALNVGIVDPGWNGPLAAALVNFGNAPFAIHRGENFLRIMFHEHDKTDFKKIVKDNPTYKKEIMGKSRMFSESFLSMDKLVDEVTERVFFVPKFGIALAIGALIVGVLSIFGPIAYSTWSDGRGYAAKIDVRVEVLEKDIKDMREQISLDARFRELEARLTKAAGSATPSLVNPDSQPK